MIINELPFISGLFMYFFHFLWIFNNTFVFFTQLRYWSQKFYGICRAWFGSNNDESELILRWNTKMFFKFFYDICETFIKISILHLLTLFKVSSLLLSQDFFQTLNKIRAEIWRQVLTNSQTQFWRVEYWYNN